MSKKAFPFNTIILAALIGLVLCLSLSLGKNPTTHAREPASDFSYTDANDKTGTLYQFKNRIVILHFWASWCAPCREELPKLIAKAHKTPEVTFMLISVDQTKEAMLDFLKPQKSLLSENIILIHDPKTVITDVFKVDGFPETIILNKDKTIARHAYGMINWGEH